METQDKTVLTNREVPQMNNRSHEKKQLIIDKAIEFFSKNGIAETRIEDVTEAVGMGKGTFYLYFKGKKDLLLHCIERLTTIVVPKEVWLDIRKQTDYKLRFQKRLIAFLEAYPTFGGILQLVNQSLESEDPDLAKKAGDAYRLLAGPLMKDLRWAVRHGWAREIDEDVIAFIMLAAGEGLGNMLKLDSRYSLEKIAEITWDFMINGIGSSEKARVEEAVSFYWELYDSGENMVRLRDISADAKSYLSGVLGKGALQVPLHNIASITLQRSDDMLSALVVMRSGKSVTLTVNGDTGLAGETEFGRYEIPLHQVARISGVIVTDGQPTQGGAE
jgi:AcrR family transcriptional regulator